MKGNTGTIGLTGASERSNCQTAKGNEVQSILMDSFDNGLWLYVNFFKI